MLVYHIIMVGRYYDHAHRLVVPVAKVIPSSAMKAYTGSVNNQLTNHAYCTKARRDMVFTIYNWMRH